MIMAMHALTIFTTVIPYRKSHYVFRDVLLINRVKSVYSNVPVTLHPKTDFFYSSQCFATMGTVKVICTVAFKMGLTLLLINHNLILPFQSLTSRRGHHWTSKSDAVRRKIQNHVLVQRVPTSRHHKLVVFRQQNHLWNQRNH